MSLKVRLIISLSWWIKAGAIEFIALSLILFQLSIKLERSYSISFFVLLDPAVLTIRPISFGIFISFRIDLIFFLSPKLKIFLDIPPPFGVFGIRTMYLPAIEMKVVRAAPFKPLSSLRTWTNITWFGLITSWILYLFEGILDLYVSLLIWLSNSIFFSLLSSEGVSLSLIEISSSSLFFASSSLNFSSSFLIFSKSLEGNW